MVLFLLAAIDVGFKILNPYKGMLQGDTSTKNKFQQIIPKSIGSIVRGFKIGVTKWFRQNTDIHNVWQRNYFDRVVRDEEELNRIRQNIIYNPTKWAEDSPHELLLDFINKK